MPLDRFVFDYSFDHFFGSPFGMNILDRSLHLLKIFWKITIDQHFCSPSISFATCNCGLFEMQLGLRSFLCVGHSLSAEASPRTFYGSLLEKQSTPPFLDRLSSKKKCFEGRYGLFYFYVVHERFFFVLFFAPKHV